VTEPVFVDVGIPGFGPERCRAYLEGTADAPPREQLVRALGLRCPAGVPRRALDVGCGPGKEIVELLRAGWTVVAIEPYPEMLALARRRAERECGPEVADGVLFLAGTLEDHAGALDPGSFGLVHAGFVLPFVRPSRFEPTFARLREAIAPGGLFVGQFFGPNDEFVRTAGPDEVSAHDVAEIRRLLASFEVLEHEEVAREGQIGRGRAKHWHVHHVIARRR